MKILGQNNPCIRGCDLGKIVPSSHKRGELRYAMIKDSSKEEIWDSAFREVIPVLDSLGKEAILIDIITG